MGNPSDLARRFREKARIKRREAEILVKEANQWDLAAGDIEVELRDPPDERPVCTICEHRIDNNDDTAQNERVDGWLLYPIHQICAAKVNKITAGVKRETEHRQIVDALEEQTKQEPATGVSEAWLEHLDEEEDAEDSRS